MKIGDEVLVFPQGQRQRAAPATVVVISANQQAIAVGFADKPSFYPWGERLELMAVHPQYGLMLFAHRRKAAGPWTEMTMGWHYEIEAKP